MPVDYQAAMMGEIATHPAIHRGQALGPDDGFGHRKMEPDPATDTPVNVVLSPFAVLRRLYYQQIIGGSEDIRLWWIGTAVPMAVQPGDIFILTEHGLEVHYIVQMVDDSLYELDSAIAVCKREVATP